MTLEEQEMSSRLARLLAAPSAALALGASFRPAARTGMKRWLVGIPGIRICRSRCGLPLGDLADDKTPNLTPEEFFALEH
jgi:hypothetical protein